MRKRLKRWVKVVITLIVIHISFFIWRQTGVLGELAKESSIHLILCIVSWIYLTFGQVMIFSALWDSK